MHGVLNVVGQAYIHEVWVNRDEFKVEGPYEWI